MSGGFCPVTNPRSSPLLPVPWYSHPIYGLKDKVDRSVHVSGFCSCSAQELETERPCHIYNSTNKLSHL